MKKIFIVSAIFLFCAAAYADSLDTSKVFIFTKEGYEVLLVSSDVPMGSKDSILGVSVAIDKEGNFYYCTSEGNSYGFVWLIKKVDKLTAKVSEVCRLNLNYLKSGYIRTINFAPNGDLYVWLALRQAKASYWNEVLVKIAKVLP